MSLIDHSALITEDQRRAGALSDHAAEIKAECAQAITAVLDHRTMANLQGAVLLGSLTQAELRAFREGMNWIREMQMTCRAALETGFTPDWPPISEDAVALARAY